MIFGKLQVCFLVFFGDSGHQGVTVEHQCCDSNNGNNTPYIDNVMPLVKGEEEITGKRNPLLKKVTL